ncbi:hypothetical protein D3C74_219660 [compost metagenome]
MVVVCIISLITLTSVLAANQRMLRSSELLTDDNKQLIGKETISEYHIVYRDGKYIDSYGNEISEGDLLKSTQNSIPKNRIIQQINLNNFIPSSIVEFETKLIDRMFISPEIITINGSVSILTKSDGEGWDLELGDQIRFVFDKYPSEVIDNQKLLIGYIKDGILNQGQVSDQLKGEYLLNIDDSGEYYVFLLNVSSDPISLKKGTLMISKSNGKK